MKGLGHLPCDVGLRLTYGGGGQCPTTTLCRINLKASFLPVSQVYSRACEHLESCLVMECLRLKSSMLFECGPLSPSLRPLDVIHVIIVPRLLSPLSVYYTEPLTSHPLQVSTLVIVSEPTLG